MDEFSSPGDTSTYLTMKDSQNDVTKLDKSDVNTISILASAYLEVSFWHSEERDEDMALSMSIIRLSLNSIEKASDISLEALLQNGRNPLLDIFAGQGLLTAGRERV